MRLTTRSQADGSAWTFFFVLSGYLITSILTAELHETGAINMGNFYIRRTLRLTPAILLLASFQFVHSAFSPHNGPEIREATWIGLFYLENWNMAFNWGPTEYMGHTWSLATEEQFYWIWPLTLLFIAKRRPMLWIGAAAMVLLFDRAFLWMDGASFGHLQFGPDSRPIGLLVGCALALIPERRWPIMPTSAPFLLLTILAIMCVSYQGDMHWQMILMPPIVSLAAAGLIVSARLGSPIAKLLALPAVVYVGRISYGLYLYTGPITFLGQRWVVRDAFIFTRSP